MNKRVLLWSSESATADREACCLSHSSEVAWSVSLPAHVWSCCHLLQAGGDRTWKPAALLSFQQSRTSAWAHGQLSGVGQKQQGHSSFQKGLRLARFVPRHLPQQTMVSLTVEERSCRRCSSVGDLSTCCQAHRFHTTVCKQLQPPGPYLLGLFQGGSLSSF